MARGTEKKMYWFEQSQHNVTRVKKIIFLGVSLVLMYLVWSLMWYDHHRSSLFFFTTEHIYSYSVISVITDLLVYLFGGASYVVLVHVWIYAWWKCMGIHVYRWEQYAALTILPFVATLFLRFYAFDCIIGASPGGALGWLLHSFITRYCGQICALFLLHVFVIVFYFMLMPYWYLSMARFVVKSMQLVVKYRLLQKVTIHIGRCIYYCFVVPIKALGQLVYNLMTGVLFKDTDLITPEDAYRYSQELLELHQQLKKKEAAARLGEVTGEHNDEDVVSSGDLLHSVDDAPAVCYVAEKKDINIVHKHYELPKMDLFIGVKKEQNDENLKQQMQERAQLLEKKLERFGVTGTVVSIKRGPVVTLFEYMPGIDTKLSKIINLEDDLAMALEALSIRIIAPIPGKALVGFEVANTSKTDVAFSALVNSLAYTKFSGSLPLILGHDTVGKEVVVDLAKMPHLLIAGSTGSGKSVALNVMLMSLLCKLAPNQLQLILIDPKRLEFMSYADIPHLVFPIITDPKKVVHVLKWVVQQMEERYEKMAQMGVRHVIDYNDKCEQDDHDQKLPFIVVVIDELSDLMLTVGRDIEDLITRITQMARAAGIHIMVATQRPSVDVITGLIKVNFPSRISFRVTSRVDSRTILDCNGADKLLGRGDMLFLDAGSAQLQRVHGAFITTAEIERVVQHIRLQGEPQYLDFADIYGGSADSDGDQDALYQEVLRFLEESDDISISLLQRKFRIGYNRSARIIDMLESHGRIMPLDGGKTRKVIRQ